MPGQAGSDERLQRGERLLIPTPPEVQAVRQVSLLTPWCPESVRSSPGRQTQLWMARTPDCVAGDWCTERDSGYEAGGGGGAVRQWR